MLHRLRQETKLELFGVISNDVNQSLDQAFECGMSLRWTILNQTCNVVHVDKTTHPIIEQQVHYLNLDCLRWVHSKLSTLLNVDVWL